MEELMNGNIQLTEDEHSLLIPEDQAKYESVWQTKVHGIWVDGYMFLNYPAIRKIFRSNQPPDTV